jgi:prepilin-type N-terminal cleavage/methylation domain-containing protein
MKKGFTLIEIMIIIVITAVLTGVIFYTFYNLLADQSLKKDFSSVVALVERAKSMSLNSKNNNSFGVHFTSSSTILFSGGAYSSTSTLEIYNLNSRTNISNISLGGISDIKFEKITGYANATGTVSLSLKNNASSTMTMTFFKTGIIQY